MTAQRISILAIVTAVLACGCAKSPLYEHHTRFLENPSRKDLEALDRGGFEGAILIIGILALDAHWVLIESAQGSRWIEVFVTPTGWREREVEGVPMLDPPKPKAVNFIITNPYVIRWARENPNTFTHKEKPLRIVEEERDKK